MTFETLGHHGAARIMGALILLAFLTWGGGSALIDTGNPAALPVIFASVPVVLGIGILAYGMLRIGAPVTAAAYLATRVFEAALLAVAAVLLMAGAAQPALAEAGQHAYLMAMAALGIGSLPFCLLLWRARLLPAWLALWGLAGYAVFALGMLADMAGLGIGIFLLVPGGLFELALALWLMLRGFALPPSFLHLQRT